METKKLWVSLLTIATALLLVATISSAATITGDLASNSSVNVRVDDLFVYPVGGEVSVLAGETISVRVVFTSDVNASDVKVKAELEGQKIDVEDLTAPFDVEDGKRYSKTLQLKVPSELKDELSDELILNIKIYGESEADGRVETEIEDIVLRVQRDSYNVEIKSVETPQSVEAGQMLPVDVVLRSMGYNDLDDLYVTASIAALGVERTAYFGDLVALECNDASDLSPTGRSCDDEDEDSVSGRLYLEVPENAKEGIYTIEVEASNDDTVSSAVTQVVISNEFSGGDVIPTVTSKTVAAGEDAEYSVLIVNPTNKLKVYRVVPETSSDLSVSASETVVAVAAGSSKAVTITASSDVEGSYDFSVNVFSGEELVKAVTLNTKVEGKSIGASPVTVLTVILAIIFVVLLIVLFVLVGKKPEKTEEFGESYY